MSILNRYTLQTLKKNRSRTAVTIVGIVLSLAMFTAVTVLTASCQNFLVKCALDTSGNWHGVFYNADGRCAADLKSNMTDEEQERDITQVFVLQRLGYHRETRSQNSYKPFIYVAGVDGGFFENMPVKLTRGQLPQNENEILLPDHMAYNGGIQYSVGNSIDMSMGYRKDSGGKVLWQDTDYIYDEVLDTEGEHRFSRRYTIVGFYERPAFENWSAPGFTALTVASQQADVPTDIYFIARDMQDTTAILYEQMAKWGASTDIASRVNLDLLRFSGASPETGYNRVLYGMAVVLIVIIVLSSVSLIYNAFSISVSERIKHFGLLSSIGATDRQLRNSVLTEAAVLCCVAVPLGIIRGITGTGITLKMTRSWITLGLESASISGTVTDVPFEMVITPAAIAVAVLLGAATVLISAWIPAKQATAISTIDAIRQTHEADIKEKDLKESRLLRRVAGFEGMLAMRNYRRSKKRYRATIISLFMSIVLFISAYSFADYLSGSVDTAIEDIDYDLIYYYNTYNDIGLEARYDLLKNTDGVTKSGYFASFWDAVTIDRAYVGEKQLLVGADRIMARMVFVDDETYTAWLVENGLDPTVFTGGENPRAVTTNRHRSYDTMQQSYTDYNVLTATGATAKLASYGAEFEIAAFCDSVPFGVQDVKYSMPLIFPFSAMEQVLGAGRYGSAVANCRMVFKSDTPRVSQARMEDYLGENQYNIYNAKADYEMNMAVVGLVRVFTYGFIGLITLIAVANVFNTISTNISLRRREFAILKSAGMSDKGFQRMMITECMIYGVRAVAYGLPVALGVNLLMWQIINMGSSGEYRFPLGAVAAAVGGVFLVVLITMIYATGKLKNENLIETLKNENI